ncbi:hypothetical protein FACS1894130_09950 [Spirochaetia bacterium]|nr:hypothetical protein FACS1894130_09950 [Spirochaetia bacterium]
MAWRKTLGGYAHVPWGWNQTVNRMDTLDIHQRIPIVVRKDLVTKKDQGVTTTEDYASFFQKSAIQLLTTQDKH